MKGYKLMLGHRDIAKLIAKKAGIPQPVAARLILLTFATILDAAARGEPVRINGFGRFEVSKRRLVSPLWKTHRVVNSLRLYPFRVTRKAINTDPTSWGQTRIRQYLDFHK